LLRTLRQLTTAEGGMCEAANWTEPAPLRSAQYAERPGAALLVFVQVPNYQCASSNLALPVIVDAAGHWRWGRTLEGVVDTIVRAADGALWAISHWVVEAHVPHLWRSADGLTWQEVALPGKENPTSLALSHLCLTGDAVQIQLDDDDVAENPEHPQKTEVWSAPLAALLARPASKQAWRLGQARSLSCPRASLHGAWRREVTKGGVVFHREGHRDGHAVHLPETLSAAD